MPPELAEQVEVGSLVRVPLAGRRVRGYVIGLEKGPTGPGKGKLRDVRALAAPVPVFTPAMLPSLRWAARHYAAPLAAVLAKTGPPNLPKEAPPVELPAVPPASGPVPEASEAAAAGGPGRAVQLVAGEGWAELIRGAAAAPVRAGRSVLAVLPSAAEAAALAERLEADYGSRVVTAAADQDAAALTAAWSRAAAQGGLVVVGTLRVGWWPVKDLSMMVLAEDGRPGMKERQTPTAAVRALAGERSAAERLQLVLVGRVPAVQDPARGNRSGAGSGEAVGAGGGRGPHRGPAGGGGGYRPGAHRGGRRPAAGRAGVCLHAPAGVRPGFPLHAVPAPAHLPRLRGPGGAQQTLRGGAPPPIMRRSASAAGSGRGLAPPAAASASSRWGRGWAGSSRSSAGWWAATRPRRGRAAP